jgi:hypothetical protein
MDKLDKDLARRIEEDHRNLHSSLDDLGEAFDKPFDEGGFTGWKLDRLWQLRDFHNKLQKHFDLEEDGGYNDDLIRLAPHLAPRISNIEEDHRKIICELNCILDILKSAVNEKSSHLANVKERVESLVEFIREHESKEYAVVQEAYYQDYGVGD